MKYGLNLRTYMFEDTYLFDAIQVQDIDITSRSLIISTSLTSYCLCSF